MRDKALPEAENSENSGPIFENLVWMTSEEAAAYLRKSAGALRTAVYRGHIRPRKFHRRLYFNRRELDRLINASLRGGV